MSSIDIVTGRKLTCSRTIWTGSGGRFLEGPHLYKIGRFYYLLAAEGGTEYGHMVTAARAASPWGPYESCPYNPILTNRNLDNSILQGVGHGDLVDDTYGNWWMLHLGFRQIDPFSQYHHLGREIFLTPVTFNDDGWFRAGSDGICGTAALQVETDRMPDIVAQHQKNVYTFDTTDWDVDWCTLREFADNQHYDLRTDSAQLAGTATTLDTPGSPTLIMMRQKEMEADISCRVELSAAQASGDKVPVSGGEMTYGEAGLTLFVTNEHHYDLAIRRTGSSVSIVRHVSVGDLTVDAKVLELSGQQSTDVTLHISAHADRYDFSATLADQTVVNLGSNRTKYLSSEVEGNCFGVMIGLYAQALPGETVGPSARFTDFRCEFTQP